MRNSGLSKLAHRMMIAVIASLLMIPVTATGMTTGGLDGNSNLGGEDFFILKLDGDGNLQ